MDVDVDDLATAEAYRSGYAEGYEAGEGDGLRDANQRMRELENDARSYLNELEGKRERAAVFVAGLHDAMHRHEEVMEAQAYEVALASLALGFGQLQDDHSLLRRLCQQVAEEFRTKAIRLVVSVDDRPNLPDHIDNLEVVADPALAQGSCRVVTGSGYAESSIGMRVAAIYEAMLQSLGIKQS
ncbi:MAG: FliH/SctL family protein [Rhodanobacter sp.]